MKLFDTHTHLEDRRFDEDRDKLIAALKGNNVVKAVTVGTNMETSQQCIDIAEKYEGIYAAVGLHPHDAKDFKDTDIQAFEKMARNKNVVAIGEIGLDYHYDFSPRDRQMHAFEMQIDMAKGLNLPAVYHIREAFGDFLPMVRQGRCVNNAVMHCYGGSVESAKICLDAGMMISFTGVITFKNASKILDVVKYVPLERLMIETDCPYMAPVPHRGKRNEPAYVIEVAKTMAQIKGISIEEMAEITYNNAVGFFNLD